MLHLVNKSPTSSPALKQCLKRTRKGCAILLMEDAVYAAISETEMASQIQKHMQHIMFYALEPDIKARSIGKKIIPGIERIDYDGFVELAAKQHPIQSWF